MNTHYLTRARKHFNCGISHIDKHNRRAWVRSLRVLGDKWLFAASPRARDMAKPVNRSAV